MRGDTIRTRGHVSRMRRGQGAVPERSSQNDSEYYQPEVLMFAREKKLLHVNRRAFGVIGRLDHSVALRELRNAIPSGTEPSQSGQYLGTLRIETCPL